MLALLWFCLTTPSNQISEWGNGKEILFEHFDVKFVFGTNRRQDEIHEVISKECSKIIMQIGHHDAGWPKGKSTSFVDYEKALNTAIPPMVRLFLKMCMFFIAHFSEITVSGRE
jgi:hypothetical protein